MAASAGAPAHAQRVRPRDTDPVRRTRDVVVPQRVVAWHEQIDPGRVARIEENGAAPTAPAHDIDTSAPARLDIDACHRLGRAHHERGCIDVEDPRGSLERFREFAE